MAEQRASTISSAAYVSTSRKGLVVSDCGDQSTRAGEAKDGGESFVSKSEVRAAAKRRNVDVYEPKPDPFL
jgi:hypothetical protein